MPTPLWARVLRQATVWGSATILAVGAYVGATIATAAFLDDRPDITPYVDAATVLTTDLVYVDPRAADVLDRTTLSGLENRAAGMSEPTRIVVWPLDGGWLGDVAGYIAAQSKVESRFLLVDADGRTEVASTLAEREPSFADTDGSAPAFAVNAALDALEEIPPRGERSEYDDGSGPPGGVWLAAAAGGGIALLAGFVALSGAVVAFSTLLLVAGLAGLSVSAFHRRRAGAAIANIAARPAERRSGRNRLAYRPPNDVLLRINKVRVTERAELLRDEVLALGERIVGSTNPVDAQTTVDSRAVASSTGYGDKTATVDSRSTWALALDCYAAAGRIADSSEGRDDLAAQADVVAGLVLVARGRQAVDAAEAGRTPIEAVGCFANPFHGAAVGAVPAIALGTGRPPASVPRQVEVCATCRAAAAKSVAAPDPLVLAPGDGEVREYWMTAVEPWSGLGYGAGTRDLLSAWNRA